MRWPIATLPWAAVPLPLTALSAFGRIVDLVWAGRPDGVKLRVEPRQMKAFEHRLVQDLSIRARHVLLDDKTRFTQQKGEKLLGGILERFRNEGLVADR